MRYTRRYWLAQREMKEMKEMIFRVGGNMENLEKKTAQASAASGLLSKLGTALIDRSRRCSCEAQALVFSPGE